MSKSKKIILLSIISVFVLGNFLAAAILNPKPARAQLSTADINFATFFGQYQVNKQMDELDKNKNFMMMNAVINAMSYFANKIAYDVAVWLASGAKGQGPFANTESFGNYLAQVAGDSLGEALGSLSESLGLNLCDLPDLRLDLMLQLGFHFAYEPPKPKCSWQQLKAAYSPENIRSKYGSMEGLSDRLSAGVAVSDSDFGVWFTAKERIDAHAREQTYGKEQDRQEGGGFKPLTDLITGNIQTPAAVMKQEIISQSPSEQGKKRESANSAQVWGAFGAGATQVAYQAASVFINTLLGTVLKNFMDQGMLPGGYKVCNPGLKITGVNLQECTSDSETYGESYYSQGGGVDNRRAAQEMYSELLMPKIKTLDNYNLTASLALCDESNHSPDTCVVDQSFIQILQSAENGDPLSVKQAIEKGWLHGDWFMVSADDLAQTDKWNCAEEAYCERNLKFLRLARILPLGFEMAASISPTGSPWSVKEVVDGYYDCNEDGLRDSAHPFCHLINPHWTIKLPKLRCNAYVYGAVAQDGVRLQECADIQHCVGYNKDGSCQAWGYCLKERPIWRFTADYCDEQYNSCLAFQDSEGENASYLLRTLDTTSCNSENDGCARYASAKWLYSTTSLWWPTQKYYDSASDNFFNPSLFFDNDVSECDAKDDGCSAFKLASDPETLIYLKKAPEYLGCYDAGPTSEALASFNQFCDFFPSNWLCAFSDLGELIGKLINGVQWPQSIAMLNNIEPQNEEECAKYARICAPEEENCNFYTSLFTGDVIPGKFTPAAMVDSLLVWNDQCPSKCNGYSAYREMPSNYANGETLTYIIPSSGNACSASEEGCASFTNLTGTEGGLEQNEYFSYLRLCITPDQNKQKNFYVYESSEKGGYQLKTYTLAKNVDGGPKQIYHDPEEMAKYDIDDNAYCSEASYEAGTADPDCHQFVDDQGNTYYAMLSKTVLVSDNCTPYRLNNSELIAYDSSVGPVMRCPYDFDLANTSIAKAAGADVVELKDNACYYMGLPGAEVPGAGESKVCSKDTVSCRAYKGNAGNNIRDVFSATFEDATTSGFAALGVGASIAVSTESTQLGGHSLRATVAGIGTGVQVQNITVTKGKSYVLSFWAKGAAFLGVVGLGYNGDEPVFGGVTSLSDVWRYFTFGPVEYEGDATSTQLTFIFLYSGTDSQPQSSYLDNIRLMEVTDYIYLVKNTLSVDPVCDSNLLDNLPGEALGCSAYTDPAKNTYYLTNFSYLCREEAVGCTALIDTFNTPDDPEPRAYNVWLRAKVGGGSEATVNVDGDQFSCMAPVGENGCYTNIFGKTIDKIEAAACSHLSLIPTDPKCLDLTNSTVYIPPDTPSSTPIYLVASKDATCKAENMGCVAIGKEKLKYSSAMAPVLSPFGDYGDVAVLNDPALYDESLCTAEAVGCKSWKSGNSNYYFKDPKQIGNTECVYKNEVKNGRTLYGWYMKDFKRCLVNPILSPAEPTGLPCTQDSDCPPYYTGIDTTTNVGACAPVPCYSDYRGADGMYDIWSFGNTGRYQGFVGECPVEQSGCNEYVDRSGEESRVCKLSGKKCEKDADCNEVSGDECALNASAQTSYYLIDNDKFTQLTNKCNGQVSLGEGCILLDKTSSPNKYWNASLSYSESLKQDDAMVDPVDSSSVSFEWPLLPWPNNANTIVKVQHDRECAVWAYCNFQQKITDQETGETTAKCYSLDVCDKANLAVGTENQCQSHPVRPEDNMELTTDLYASLKTDLWNSLDFSGYSTPGKIQVPDLKVRQIMGKYYLVYPVWDPIECPVPPEGSMVSFPGSSCDGGLGFCYNGECIHQMNNDSGGNPVTQGPSLSCRSYPEALSPFPTSILSESSQWSSGLLRLAVYKEGFEDAPLCYDGLDEDNLGALTSDCDCSYNKLKTGSGSVNEPSSIVVDHICIGGARPGAACDETNIDDEDGTHLDCCYSDTDKGNCGVCEAVTGYSVMTGWNGYCMEKDMRQRVNGVDVHRCMTWYPLELPPGSTNIWSSDLNAGYEPTTEEVRDMCLVNQPIKYDVYSEKSEIYKHATDDSGDEWICTLFNFGEDPPGINIQPYNTTGHVCSDQSLVSGNIGFYVGFSVSNTIVMGCPNEGNDAYAFWSKPYGGTDARIRWCPINRNTIHEYETNGDWKMGSAEQIIEQSNRPKYFSVDDIERIDVGVDGWPGHSCDAGYVSFIRNFVKNPDDDVDGYSPEFVISATGLEGCTEAVQYKAYAINDGAYKYYEWSHTTDNTALSPHIVYGDHVDEYVDRFDFHEPDISDTGQDSAYSAGFNGWGVRLVLNSSQTKVKGIMMLTGDDIGEDDMGDEFEELEGDATLAFYFAVHFTDGTCSKYARVSADSDMSESDFKFKPFAGRLVMDKTGIYTEYETGGDVRLMGRPKALNFANYGLLNQAAGLPEGQNAFFINPFIPFGTEDYEQPTQAGSLELPYENHDAGVPLIAATTQHVIDNKPAWFVFDQYGGTYKEKPYVHDLLKRMFAKVWGIGTSYYNETEDAYVFNDFYGEDSFDAAHPNNADTIDLSIYPPRIAAPKVGGGFVMDGIAVNNANSGPVYLPSGASAFIQFFAWAHPNQMPLRTIAVNKSMELLDVSVDQVFQITSKSLGNKKYKCGPHLCQYMAGDIPQFDETRLSSCETDSDCSGFTGFVCPGGDSSSNYLGFGSMVGYGCHEGPEEFIADYTCDASTDSIVKIEWGEAGLTTEEWNYVKANFGQKEYVCRYTPAVYALDNWGWCTGECSDDYADDSAVENPGCYSEFTIGNECSIIPGQEEPWIPFAGKVIVVPTE